MNSFLDFLIDNISLIIGLSLEVAWLIFSLYYIYKVKRSLGFNNVNRLIYDSIPSNFTFIGIFGTFGGIFLGLLNFDVKNIDSSIPSLLNGLRTAFATSIAGIFFSFIFSKITKGQTKKYSQEENKDIPDLLITNNILLKTISHNLETSFNKTNITLTNIENNFSQINFNLLQEIVNILKDDVAENKLEKIRHSIITQHNELMITINDLSQIIAESNTKALVEVFQSATEEFNKQMSAIVARLVKENFDQLNESVQNMNKWQQENKEMITMLINNFRLVAEQFTITSKSINEIVENTKKLTDDNSVLQRLIKELNEVMIEDKKFQKIIDSVSTSIEILKNTINEFSENTTQLTEWSKKQQEFTHNVDLLIKKLNEVKNIKDINEIFWKNLEEQLNKAVNMVKDANTSLNQSLFDLNKQFEERLNITLNSLDQLIQRIMKKYDNTLN